MHTNQGLADFRSELLSDEALVKTAIKDELANVKEYNKHLNAFITIFEIDSEPISSQLKALAKARRKKAPPLFGIPFAIKDNVFLKGYTTTAGSGAFRDFVPPINADIVDDFLSLGAVPLGKTNLHELAMGATSSSSYFGPVRNPRDLTRISGGSSGGSAVAVAMSKYPLIGIGTDTGGSVRIPAALCGICGLKPSFGRLSAAGVFPLSATLDHVGLLAKNMEDLKESFAALVEEDRRQEIPKRKRGKKMTIGIPGEYFFSGAHRSVIRDFRAAIERIRKSGEFEIVEEFEIPDFSRVARARISIHVKEAAWFYSSLVSQPELRKLVRPDVLTFLDLGTKKGMLEYMQALGERIFFIQRLSQVFRRVDFISMPTCLTIAPKLDEIMGKEARGIRRLLVRNTEPFNFSGFPALSIPMHRLDSNVAFPTGLQLAAGPYCDFELLDAGVKIWGEIHSR